MNFKKNSSPLAPYPPLPPPPQKKNLSIGKRSRSFCKIHILWSYTATLHGRVIPLDGQGKVGGFRKLN